MLRQDQNRTETDRNGSAAAPVQPTNGAAYVDPPRSPSVDIQQELNRLEEMILDSPRIPLTRRTMVDEEQILDQLDLIRLNLPSAFQEATDIIRQRDDLLLEAEHYVQELIQAAEQRAAEILDELGIIQQANLEAQQLRQRVQQECEALHEQTRTEIQQLQRQAQQDLEQMRQAAIAEAKDIQAGADAYADRTLREMEQQLTEIMRIVRNGRQQLQVEPPASRPRDLAGNGSPNRNSQTSRN